MSEVQKEKKRKEGKNGRKEEKKKDGRKEEGRKEGGWKEEKYCSMIYQKEQPIFVMKAAKILH